MERHPEADTSPVSIEASDALDAAAGLLVLAKQSRADARRRSHGGERLAAYRRGLRAQAVVYEAAARRIQAAADARFTA